MPSFVDPLFPAKYSWQTRHDSVVKIASPLPLYDHGWLSLTLKIQRNFLAQLFKDGPLENDPGSYDGALLRSIQGDNDIQELIRNWSPPEIRCYFFCQQIVFRLKALSEDGSPRREKILSIPVLPSVSKAARFLVSRDSLPPVKLFFSAPAPEGWTHISALTRLIKSYLLSPMVLKRIISPARGREFKKQMFLDLLPGAYFMCTELVVGSRDDEDIREEVSKLLAMLMKTDELAKPYLEARINDESFERFAVPCLVYWGFYGAWEKFNVAPFQLPEDLLRQYMYGGNRKRMAEQLSHATNLDTTIPNKTLERAKELYLKQRGAAAKAFDLV